MKTQAFLLSRKGAAGKAFKLSDVEIGPPGADEVLVEVEAFGINHIDVALRLGKHSDSPVLPCAIGQEVVGRVVQAGEQVDEALLGKRVVALTRLGGYARHAIAPVGTLAEVGETDTNAALALALQGITAYYMCCCASSVLPGENVLIHAAAGGVGTLLAQLAKNAGATVIAKVGSEEKRRKCLSLGADFAINYRREDYASEVERLIGRNRLDVSFNPVGGRTFRQDRRLLGTGSRLVLFGGLELTKSRFGILSQLNFLCRMGLVVPVFLPVRSQSILGVDMLKIAETKPRLVREYLQELLSMHRKGILMPESGGAFQASELTEAHELLESGKSMGKLTVHW